MKRIDWTGVIAFGLPAVALALFLAGLIAAILESPACLVYDPKGIEARKTSITIPDSLVLNERQPYIIEETENGMLITFQFVEEQEK